MPFKIDLLELQDGLKLRPGKLTAIVGPNNVGKTQMLRDILAFTTVQDAQGVIVSHLGLTLPETLEELKVAAKGALKPQPDGNTLIKTLGATLGAQHFGGNLGRAENWESQVQQALEQSRQGQRTVLITWFGSHFVSFLRTADRLRLADRSSTAMDPGDVPNLLVALYRDKAALEARLDGFFSKAFGLHIKLDYSDLGQILFRVGSAFGGLPPDQREAAPLLSKLPMLDNQGDGMRSFVGAALSLLVEERPVVLLDEPEAFLHPPQAVQLGEIIAELSNSGRQVFVATHSADIVRGMLNRGGDFDIVRLTREGDSGASKRLDASAVRVFANDPVLSTTRVLEGLFYRAAIAVEADSDAVFYHRVARGIRPHDDILYIRAHNKQTLHKLLEPYRRLGVLAGAISDFDLIKKWDELLPLLQAVTDESLEEPRALQEAIRSRVQSSPIEAQLLALKRRVEDLVTEWPNEITLENGPREQAGVRRALKQLAESADPWAAAKGRGVDALPEDARPFFERLRAWCARRGVFILRSGELESLLVAHGLPIGSARNKGHWIVSALAMLNDLTPSAKELPWSVVVEAHEYLLGPADGAGVGS